jgi:hypothetical protein
MDWSIKAAIAAMDDHELRELECLAQSTRRAWQARYRELPRFVRVRVKHGGTRVSFVTARRAMDLIHAACTHELAE